MLTPLRDKVVVRLVVSAKETSGGIVRPDSLTNIRRVECVAIGPDCHSAEVGEQYLANVITGQEFGEEHIVLPEKALLAVWLEKLA